VLNAIASALRMDSSQVAFEHAVVFRGGLEQSVEYAQIDALGHSLTPMLATAALSAWQSLEPGLGYYRLQDSRASTVAVIDVASGDRWWAGKALNTMEDLPQVEIRLEPWQAACNVLARLAGKSDRRLSA
jgi:hypothetical protein